ncbi:FtsW/RodA/SpoVE family cell cycle protein [Apilactobacillus ozensis]|uniref:FtsW/RodA/SpoVE family cell cycle protein n=1 Tax=Apilactobacillus ozensis TaxID=866801 RepID=UPI002009FF5D|nr:FtsW/RodA/SpoVE family cell cycle protein [Apilactobacillus ozensis]MCK8607317.1 FtsW/RodA/SpoVE family cell cycle protein [Apilactobacillus ozensis]
MKKFDTLRSHFKNLDYYIFIPYIILSLIGVIMVYSASYSTAGNINPSGILIKQAAYFIVGLLIIVIVMNGNNKIIKNKKFISILGIILFFALFYLRFFGNRVNGAAGWINLGPINIQPAEVAKIYFIMRFARVLQFEDTPNIEYKWKEIFYKRLIYSLIIISLIAIQPDLGGAFINLSIIFVIVLSSGIGWKGSVKLLILFAILLFGGARLILYPLIKLGLLHGYQASRIISFVNPFENQDAGYQVINSYYALSNGGILGRGLGNSVQKNGYLPEPYTDFIMSVISEELGLITVLLILSLLMCIVCRIILVGVRAKTIYDRVICYGIAFYITIQALVNTGAVTGMMPITGVTFPFISYGGSSMLTLSFCIGLTLLISANQGKRS